LKVNPESSPEHAAAGQKYGITGYPTIAFLSAEGDLLSLNSGYQEAGPFAELMAGTLKDEERMKQLKAEIQKTPNDPKANVELALIYVKRGNLEQGQPLVDKALKLDAENKTGLLPELHLNLGLHYGTKASTVEDSDDYYQKSEMYFKTVVQKYSRSPFYEQGQLYLGITYAIQEKYELAIVTLEKLKNAKDPAVKGRAAEILESVKHANK
jgi:tetratricopeptide (TPR) repeat protein